MPKKTRLPDFTSPPVSEVIIGVQFAELAAMNTTYVGLLWSKIRKQYPKASELAPVGPVFEVFGVPHASMQPMFQFQTLMAPPFPRYRFESADTFELFQLQQNRLYHNWMKLTDDQKYPRFEHVRSGFKQDFEAVADFIAAEKLGEIKINQCEVNYTNTVTLAEGANPHAEIARVMTIANEWPDDGQDLPVLENTTIQSQAILHRDGEPTCRLHLALQPVFVTATGKSAIQLSLTARGKPAGEGLHEALELIDFCHAGIVNTFKAITTSDMHKIWGLKNG